MTPPLELVYCRVPLAVRLLPVLPVGLIREGLRALAHRVAAAEVLGGPELGTGVPREAIGFTRADHDAACALARRARRSDCDDVAILLAMAIRVGAEEMAMPLRPAAVRRRPVDNRSRLAGPRRQAA